LIKSDGKETDIAVKKKKVNCWNVS